MACGTWSKGDVAASILGCPAGLLLLERVPLAAELRCGPGVGGQEQLGGGGCAAGVDHMVGRHTGHCLVWLCGWRREWCLGIQVWHVLSSRVLEG